LLDIVPIFALAAALGIPAATPQGLALTVSAAISLTDALEEAGRAYRASGGGEVRFNFAGSNVLARQIVNGAPVDLFISADEAQMQLAADAGSIAAGTRVDLLRNRLAVVVSSSAPPIEKIQDLIQPAFRRIALGDPQAVPAGVYAKAYLQAVNLWSPLASRIVPVANVRAALTAVETGSADAAILYRSDLNAASRARLAFVVSGAGAPRIIYPAAVVQGSRQRAEAERFLAFLRGAQAAAIFTRYGFEPFPGPTR